MATIEPVWATVSRGRGDRYGLAHLHYKAECQGRTIPCVVVLTGSGVGTPVAYDLDPINARLTDEGLRLMNQLVRRYKAKGVTGRGCGYLRRVRRADAERMAAEIAGLLSNPALRRSIETVE
jgi:hypothetical protein